MFPNPEKGTRFGNIADNGVIEARYIVEQKRCHGGYEWSSWKKYLNVDLGPLPSFYSRVKHKMHFQ